MRCVPRSLITRPYPRWPGQFLFFCFLPRSSCLSPCWHSIGRFAAPRSLELLRTAKRSGSAIGTQNKPVLDCRAGSIRWAPKPFRRRVPVGLRLFLLSADFRVNSTRKRLHTLPSLFCLRAPRTVGIKLDGFLVGFDCSRLKRNFHLVAHLLVIGRRHKARAQQI